MDCEELDTTEVIYCICTHMDCSTAGFPVQNQLPELAQIHVHWWNSCPVMPSNHLILCCPLLLLPSIFPSIRVFSNESILCIRWPKYWGFSLSISLSNGYSRLISFRKKQGDWNAKVWCQEIPGVTGKFGLGVQNEAKANRVLPREPTGYSKHPLPTTQENTLHIDTTRWSVSKSDCLYSLQSKMEKLSTVSKKQDPELTVAQTMNFLLPNSDLNWRK